MADLWQIVDDDVRLAGAQRQAILMASLGIACATGTDGNVVGGACAATCIGRDQHVAVHVMCAGNFSDRLLAPCSTALYWAD